MYNDQRCCSGFKRTDGPLFRGRYKSLLIDADAYLLQVGRYIHRNPLEVRGAAKDVLEVYQWSSYLAYVNRGLIPSWLTREQTYRPSGVRVRAKITGRAYSGEDDRHIRVNVTDGSNLPHWKLKRNASGHDQSTFSVLSWVLFSILLRIESPIS